MLYVNMVDKFLSGWGSAKGGKSRYSVRCETLEQAEKIERAAHRRSEMRYITIADNPSRCGKNDHLSVRDFADLGEGWTRG